MSELPKVLQDFQGFIDGVGKAGVVQEIKLPDLVLKTQEYIAGGMVAPIDIGMGDVEKLDCEMTFGSLDKTVVGHFGKNDLPFTARGAQSNGTKTEAIILQMRGLMKSLETGTFKKGESLSPKKVFNANYLKLTIDGEEKVEIDAVNGIFKVGGKDLRAAINEAIGK
jgi:P2 family phage contractile tail tube protein